MKYPVIQKVHEGRFITRRDIDYLTEAGQAKTYGSIGRKPNIKTLKESQNRKPYSAIPILTDESDQRILVGRE